MKQKHVSHPRMLVAAAVAALYAVPAVVAQAADIKVDVTGSNIKRIEGEGALPVQVIGRDEIDKSGVEPMGRYSSIAALGSDPIVASSRSSDPDPTMSKAR